MDKQNLISALSQKGIALLCLLIFSSWLMPPANAQEVEDLLFNAERSSGSRIKDANDTRCKKCEENEANAKLEYLERVLSSEASNSYQKKIESMIFSNEKFVNGCWKNANDKGVEIFFTVSESGQASDFAFFPKHRVRKCIRRHISKIEFPSIDKPHHAWLVASGK